MCKQILCRGFHFLHYISGNSSWKLHPHEMVVIDAVVNKYLNPEIRKIVQAQLKKSFFVERMSERRINVLRFYDADNLIKIKKLGFSDMLLNVSIVIDGKKQIAHVTFFKGFIFSVEFKKPGKFYEGKEIKVDDIKLGKPDQTFTKAIDRYEHGRETDEEP